MAIYRITDTSSLSSPDRGRSLKSVASVDLSYVIVGGGGGASGTSSGGGGAGGYRSNFLGESSGGGASAESRFFIEVGEVYALTVGAGGAAGASGSNSQFGPVISLGGGTSNTPGGSGGGGTGLSDATPPSDRPPGGSGAPGQGYPGGNGWSVSSSAYTGGGGGGAGGAGSHARNHVNLASPGGIGLTTAINGTPVTLAVGGIGNSSFATSAGASNTGNGGRNEAGGSGIIMLRIPGFYEASFSPGVTQTPSTVGSDKIYTITAAGPTDTVTFS
jgi:hypothetical protein